jgi:NADPH-dependent 2,4-dienoyl-CoA reductase/sulfur reductase-like enzyme
MSSHSPRLVVVGASLAGLRAIEAARAAGHDGPVVLVGAESELPYDRPPLSKAYLDATGADEVPDVRFRDEAHLRDVLGAELVLGSPASALDTDAREVVVDDRRIGYDAAVIATGARARTLQGAEGLAGVHTLRTLGDAAAVRNALEAGARTVVVGAGFIGSEVASGARRRGLPVTIVESAPTPLVRSVGEQMGAALSALHTDHGTGLRCGAGVAAIEGAGGRVTGVRLTDGTVLAAEIVVVGVGAVPETDWLVGSGVVLDDGVVADGCLATAMPGVYAAGDVVSWPNGLFAGHRGGRMRLEHWTSAAEQGAVAARNALFPQGATPYETVPYFWSDWYTSRIQFVGVPAADEVRVVSGSVSARSFVALYRTGDRLTGALTLDRRADVMKYRVQIARRTGWDEALRFAEQRNATAGARPGGSMELG